MIKIQIDKNAKMEIEDIYIKDAHRAQTGIFRVMEKANVKAKLQKDFPKIHDALYDPTTGEPEEEKIKKLLLADRKELKEYISMFGHYNANQTKYLLENVFIYDRYARRRSACQILDRMGVTVCPYCNRQYIHTVASGKARPQLDHYYPKKLYPYLAVSLYNMIPSCSICNMAKSLLDTLKTPVVYPFDEEFGYDAKFEIQIKGRNNYVKVMEGISDEFVIDLNAKKANNAAEINTQMQKLHLDELYSKHTDYVMDIIKSKNINTPERIHEICKTFPKLFGSNDEVKNILYMTDLGKESWGKRPLSKLTHDIDMQLESGNISYVK